MDLKSLNRPTIPVRMNRRTQLKPLSRLNGDWLPLLKKIKTSEMSQQVRGHNASEDLRTRRLVDQWFGEFAWQLGKLRKAQGGAMTDLARLHLERRQLKRHMLLWRQEEARQEADRQKEREARREEMERVTKEIERRTRNLQRDGRRMSIRLNAALFQAGRRGSRVRTDSEPLKLSPSPEPENLTQQNLPVECGTNDSETTNKEVTESLQKSDENIQASSEEIPTIRREHSNHMVKSKVLEVTKHGAEPLVRTRTKSDLTEEGSKSPSENIDKVDENRCENYPSAIVTDSIDSILNTNKVIPPITKSPENCAAIRVTLSVPKRSRQRKTADLRCIFPTIDENKGHEIDTKTDINSSPHTNSPGSTSITPSSVKSNTNVDRQPRVSIVMENRLRMKKRREYEKSILKEPYNIYRRDSKGRLCTMDQLPVPPKFEEPSNRESYRRSVLLRNEKINFDDKMRSLESFTYNCIQEDIRLLNELQQPKTNAEETKPRLDEKFDEVKTFGPADWMRVFLHSTLPDGVDPESHESLHHCRYIRKDEKKHEPSHKGGKEIRNRVSSWDPVK